MFHMRCRGLQPHCDGTRDVGSIKKVRGTYILGDPQKQKWHYLSRKGAVHLQVCQKVGVRIPYALPLQNSCGEL